MGYHKNIAPTQLGAIHDIELTFCLQILVRRKRGERSCLDGKQELLSFLNADIRR